MDHARSTGGVLNKSALNRTRGGVLVVAARTTLLLWPLCPSTSRTGTGCHRSADLATIRSYSSRSSLSAAPCSAPLAPPGSARHRTPPAPPTPKTNPTHPQNHPGRVGGSRKVGDPTQTPPRARKKAPQG